MRPWLAACLLAAACTPQGPARSEDYDSVITVPADETDFSALRRYRIADRVVDLTPNSIAVPDGGVPVDDPFLEAFLIGNVRDNLNARGFVEEPAPETTPPDVLLLIAVQRDDWVSWSFWGTWGWYSGWDWWGGPWGTGSSLAYPAAVSAVSFSTGTLHIDMVRPDPSSPDQPIPVVWSASINGLLGDRGIPYDRLDFLLDQAFAQSPYLTVTP